MLFILSMFHHGKLRAKCGAILELSYFIILRRWTHWVVTLQQFAAVNWKRKYYEKSWFWHRWKQSQLRVWNRTCLIERTNSTRVYLGYLSCPHALACNESRWFHKGHFSGYTVCSNKCQSMISELGANLMLCTFTVVKYDLICPNNTMGFCAAPELFEECCHLWEPN